MYHTQVTAASSRRFPACSQGILANLANQTNPLCQLCFTFSTPTPDEQSFLHNLPSLPPSSLADSCLEAMIRYGFRELALFRWPWYKSGKGEASTPRVRINDFPVTYHTS